MTVRNHATAPKVRKQPGYSRSPLIGDKNDIVVLSVDLCSFSAFIHAKVSDASLVERMMGSFIRDMRDTMRAFNGIPDDRVAGDGVLCYWQTIEPARYLERCVSQLLDVAIHVANEWQRRIDEAVEPKGLRAGAAIGRVLFLEERRGLVHALGEGVNMAVRLQAAPSLKLPEPPPNCLVVSNRLYELLFADRSDFSRDTFQLKNMGSVIGWRKCFGSGGGA